MRIRLPVLYSTEKLCQNLPSPDHHFDRRLSSIFHADQYSFLWHFFSKLLQNEHQFLLNFLKQTRIDSFSFPVCSLLWLYYSTSYTFCLQCLVFLLICHSISRINLFLDLRYCVRTVGPTLSLQVAHTTAKKYCNSSLKLTQKKKMLVSSKSVCHLHWSTIHRSIFPLASSICTMTAILSHKGRFGFWPRALHYIGAKSWAQATILANCTASSDTCV